jgi:hypothetical protein
MTMPNISDLNTISPKQKARVHAFCYGYTRALQAQPCKFLQIGRRLAAYNFLKTSSCPFQPDLHLMISNRLFIIKQYSGQLLNKMKMDYQRLAPY